MRGAIDFREWDDWDQQKKLTRQINFNWKKARWMANSNTVGAAH